MDQSLIQLIIDLEKDLSFFREHLEIKTEEEWSLLSKNEKYKLWNAYPLEKKMKCLEISKVKNNIKKESVLTESVSVSVPDVREYINCISSDEEEESIIINNSDLYSYEKNHDMDIDNQDEICSWSNVSQNDLEENIKLNLDNFNNHFQVNSPLNNAYDNSGINVFEKLTKQIPIDNKSSTDDNNLQRLRQEGELLVSSQVDKSENEEFIRCNICDENIVKDNDNTCEFCKDTITENININNEEISKLQNQVKVLQNYISTLEFDRFKNMTYDHRL